MLSYLQKHCEVEIQLFYTSYSWGDSARNMLFLIIKTTFIIVQSNNNTDWGNVLPVLKEAYFFWISAIIVSGVLLWIWTNSPFWWDCNINYCNLFYCPHVSLLYGYYMLAICERCHAAGTANMAVKHDRLCGRGPCHYLICVDGQCE